MRPEICLLHVHGESIGYGRYGVQLHAALERAGVDVYDHLDGTEHREQLSVPESKRTNVVCWISVPTHATGWWGSQVPVISTMWEATVLPESFRENLHEFETVIVPSDHNLELFSRYHPNVRRVLLGVDPDVWHYTERRPPTTTFDYLIGGSGKRKGTDLAVRAFRKLWGQAESWGDGPIPQLVMKNPKGESFYGERIQMVTGRMSAQAEVELYSRAHVYLQPSRGEGFGLQPLQAMAQGCPTILTAAHGHGSFAHLGMGLSTTFSPSDYFIYGDAGDWWEPSFDELCEQMEWAYFNYDEACAKAKDSAAVIANDFTWDRTAEQFIEAVGADALATPYGGDGVWHKPEARRYYTVLNRDWACEIAGLSYQFVRGQEYWEAADVKRILFEAALLDPRCIRSEPGSEADLGLNAAQVAKIGDYTAAHSHCALCGHKLDDGPTRADEIFAELQAAAGQ